LVASLLAVFSINLLTSFFILALSFRLLIRKVIYDDRFYIFSFNFNVKLKIPVHSQQKLGTTGMRGRCMQLRKKEKQQIESIK